jgi:hypothetical protein
VRIVRGIGFLVISGFHEAGNIEGVPHYERFENNACHSRKRLCKRVVVIPTGLQMHVYSAALRDKINKIFF